MIKCDILFLCGNQVRIELRNFKVDIVSPTAPIASSIETLRVKCTLSHEREPSPQHIERHIYEIIHIYLAIFLKINIFIKAEQVC